ncbi:MAG: reverse transcriptase-like protein [Pseudomonadota bacterium]|nr:reverse transcriptase-like protein [Pseudomonadota bacterium]
MATAVVARGRLYHQPELGHGSSHQAEWLALLHAVGVAREVGAADVLLLGDSRIVIDQANGAVPCRGLALRDCLARFEGERGHFARLRVRHIKRTQNLAGIALDRFNEEASMAKMTSKEPLP